MPHQWQTVFTLNPASIDGNEMIEVSTSLEFPGEELFGSLASLLSDEDTRTIFELMGITIFPEKLEAIENFEHTRQSTIELEEKLPQLKYFPIEKIDSTSLEDNMKFCDMGEIEVARASDSEHILYTTDAASCIIIIACAYNSDGEYQQIAAMTHDDSSGEFIAEELEKQFGNQYHWKYYIAGGTPHVYERITDIYEEQVEILGNLAFCNIQDLYFDVCSNKILSKERYVIENQNMPASQDETTAAPTTEATSSVGPMFG